MVQIGPVAVRPNPLAKMQDDWDSTDRPLRLPFIPLLIVILLAIVWVGAQPRHEPWSHHHRWSHSGQCSHHAWGPRHRHWAPPDPGRGSATGGYEGRARATF